MLRNFVQETTNAPGTSASVNLAGAPTGRVTWASQFATGAQCFYGMDDGSQSEAGIGTFTSGTPNTFSRDSVLWNSAGTTSRLNFSGTTKIYNDVPAEHSVYLDQFKQSLGTTGYITLPGGLIIQWGSSVVTIASNTAVITLPIAFPTTFYTVVVSNGDLNAFNGLVGETTNGLSSFTVGTPGLASGSVRANWVAFGK